MNKKNGLIFGLTLLTSLTAFSQSVVTSGSSLTVNLSNFDPDGYVVEAGGSLTFLDNATMPTYNFNPNRGIVVHTDGYLQIYRGELTSASVTNPWNGITLDAKSSSNLNYALWFTGRPHISISNAKTGVYCKPTTTGGAVGYAADIMFQLANEIVFANNRDYDLLIENAFDGANPKNNFTTVSNAGGTQSVLMFQGSSSSTFNSNIKIVNTIMENDLANLELNSPTMGIHLNNSKINVEYSKINKMNIGILDENYINISGSGFYRNIFTGQQSTCILNQSYNFTLLNNDIIGSKEVVTEMDSESSLIMGNRVSNCESYIYLGIQNNNAEIRGNVFNFSGFSNNTAVTIVESNNTIFRSNQMRGSLTTNPYAALYVGNSGNTTIRNNFFKDYPVNMCIIENSPISSLCKNEFYSPTTTAIQVNGWLQDQGTPTQGTRNTFFLNPGENRVISTTPVTFHNTNYIPVSEQDDNNIWSSNANHVYVSTSELCAITKQSEITEEKSQESVILSPNPFTDIVYLDNIDHLKAVKIFSLEGKLVRTISDVSSEIYFDNLESGTYFIHLIDQNSQVDIQKLIKL